MSSKQPEYLMPDQLQEFQRVPPYPQYPTYLPYPIYGYVPKLPPQPKPRGVPKKGYFVAGSIGMFIMAATAIAIGIYALATFSLFLFYYGYSNSLQPIVSIILFILFYIGVLISLFSFYGLYWNYGSLMGLSTFIYGLIASSIFLVSMILPYVAMESDTYCIEYSWGGYCTEYATYYYPASWTILIALAGLILMGVLFILMGASVIVDRRYTGYEGSGMASGVIFIIAGSFFCSILLMTFGGLFLLAPAGIISGIMFLKAMLPVPIAAAPAPPHAKPVAQPKASESATKSEERSRES